MACNPHGTITLNNGRQMPFVGFGTWKCKPGEVETAVKVAIETGYRHIDCAWVYQNEREVGNALREVFAEGKVTREELFIVSKLWCTAHQPQDVQPNFQDSLDMLGLDYLDLYLVHWPHSYKPSKEISPKDDAGNTIYTDTPPLETWKAMETLVDLGLTKSIGVANFNSVQVQELLDKGRIKPAVNQVEVHPYNSNARLVEYCQTRGVVITGYGSLGSHDRPWGVAEEPVVLDEPVLATLAEKYKRTKAQVILRWLLQRNILIIPKSVTKSRIQENYQVADFNLSDTDVALINSLDRNLKIVTPMVERNGKREFSDKDAPNFPFNIEF